MICHDAVDERQAKAGASSVSREEGYEYPGNLLGGDTAAIVRDGELNALWRLGRGNAYHSRFVRIACLGTVAEKIAEGLAQSGRVADNLELRRKVFASQFHAGLIGAILKHRKKRKRFLRQSGRPSEIQKIIHDARERRGLRRDLAGEVAGDLRIATLL